jgi:hypothetical protein
MIRVRLCARGGHLGEFLGSHCGRQIREESCINKIDEMYFSYLMTSNICLSSNIRLVSVVILLSLVR